MLPAFGFSVGDFIAAIGMCMHAVAATRQLTAHVGLIAKVSKALKDEAGAANEYQHVLLELQALERTLRHLQVLEPTDSNVEHVNAVRGMALACRIPLQEFLVKLQKFEASMGPFAIRRRDQFKSVGRKSQWAVFMGDEVARLRSAVGAKVRVSSISYRAMILPGFFSAKHQVELC